MSRFYEPDLGSEPDSPFARDAQNKLVRRSYWLDMNDRSLVMARSAEVGFSPFFCLSHSRDFRYGPHNPLDLTCAGLARAVKIEVAREDLREAITYQKSTTSKPVSAAPRTSIDQSPASRPKRRSAAVLARITGVLSALRGGSALPASWNDPVTTSV